jgi:hypothetical protein
MARMIGRVEAAISVLDNIDTSFANILSLSMPAIFMPIRGANSSPPIPSSAREVPAFEQRMFTSEQA